MLRVLHVYRGYRRNLLNPLVDNQIEGFSNFDFIKIEKYILKKGGMEYFKGIILIRKYVREKKIDIIHAHYSFSGIISAMSLSGVPVICSLMGSDVFYKKRTKSLLSLFVNSFWSKTIVKSQAMKKKYPKSIVIPNGVNFLNFRPIIKSEAMKRVKFSLKEKHILFISTNPYSEVKNLELAKKAIDISKLRKPEDKIKLHILSQIDFKSLPYYYNAADLLLLTSKSEGSPNVVKEAMACNCPIVSTDVGDVKEIVSDIDGCFITSFDPRDVAEKISKALRFGKRTKGRKKIKHLDNNIIAKKIIKVYQQVIKENN